MLDWNMPVSAWQVIIPPVASAVVSLISVWAAYLIGRGSEARKQCDLIYESNHKAMNDLFASVNQLTSAMDRHIAAQEDPSNQTFDKMWELTTGVSWVPGRRDGKILNGVLQPTDEGLIVDVWLRTNIHFTYSRLQQRDKEDEYQDHLLRSEINKLHTRLLKWSIRDLPVSWFVKDLTDTGMRIFHPLYYSRQSALTPLNVSPAAQEFFKKGMLDEDD
ncbi:hypothetical protein [Specibacter cremeus]|uniref:hypothetical protein n=1 Tax=Specibacter cremeus TaxID=1629051 RepID=UPI000F7A4ADE|nr:hypothetical protein [Specibacter cremeus]